MSKDAHDRHIKRKDEDRKEKHLIKSLQELHCEAIILTFWRWNIYSPAASRDPVINELRRLVYQSDGTVK